MKDFVIITDSACDLNADIVEANKIEVVPMNLELDGKSYKHYPDYREISSESIYSKLRDGIIGTTACVSVGDAEEAITSFVKKGFDVLYLAFSSGMSGSYNSARIAAENVQENYPDARIEVIDTKSGATGQGMLAYMAAKQKELGQGFEQVSQYVKDKMLHIAHYFTVDDLKYLKKSGRISTLSAVAGTVLNIKPIFKLSDEGKIAMKTKVRGAKASVQKLVDFAVNQCTSHDLFFICHAENKEGANNIVEKLKEFFPNAEYNICGIGPIIGNNTGPGTLGLFFETATR